MTPNPKKCSQAEMNHWPHCALVFPLSLAIPTATISNNLKWRQNVQNKIIFNSNSKTSPLQLLGERVESDSWGKKKKRLSQHQKVRNRLLKPLVNRCIMKFPILPLQLFVSCNVGFYCHFIMSFYNGNDAEQPGYFRKSYFP